MESPIYEGSHRTLFEKFLKLVDDSTTHSKALLNLLSWEDARSLLSIGGGKGIIESSLLHNAPKAKVWYLDPSPEQCKAFLQHMEQEDLGERVTDVAEVAFQEYDTSQTFDRILSVFSWYFIGANRQSLTNLLNLLTPNGTACLILPNKGSIFADFTRSMSPDKQMTLVGEEVISVLNRLECTVSQHTYTKWLSSDELFDGEAASKASLAFAAFVAMRPISSFTTAEKEHIVSLLKARQEANGVPLKSDIILVKRTSS